MRKLVWALLGAVIVLVRGWPSETDKATPERRGAATGGPMWGWDGASLGHYAVAEQSDPDVDRILERW